MLLKEINDRQCLKKPLDFVILRLIIKKVNAYNITFRYILMIKMMLVNKFISLLVFQLWWMGEEKSKLISSTQPLTSFSSKVKYNQKKKEKKKKKSFCRFNACATMHAHVILVVNWAFKIFYADRLIMH